MAWWLAVAALWLYHNTLMRTSTSQLGPSTPTLMSLFFVSFYYYLPLEIQYQFLFLSSQVNAALMHHERTPGETQSLRPCDTQPLDLRISYGIMLQRGNEARVCCHTLTIQSYMCIQQVVQHGPVRNLANHPVLIGVAPHRSSPRSYTFHCQHPCHCALYPQRPLTIRREDIAVLSAESSSRGAP